MDIRIKYQEELNTMLQTLLKMGVLVEEAISKALYALDQHDEELADEVIEKDKDIDAIRADIEDNCIRIIATEQPVAHDLREIMTTIKIVSHIERIGDHARHLARAVKEIPEEYLAQVYPRLKQMADIGLSMLKDSLDSFVNRDAVKAEEAAKRDVQIDEIHKQLYQEIIDMMREQPKAIEYGSTLLFLNRFMERLGDHVIDICDWVCYANTGKRMGLSR